MKQLGSVLRGARVISSNKREGKKNKKKRVGGWDQEAPGFRHIIVCQVVLHHARQLVLVGGGSKSWVRQSMHPGLHFPPKYMYRCAALQGLSSHLPLILASRVV